MTATVNFMIIDDERQPLAWGELKVKADSMEGVRAKLEAFRQKLETYGELTWEEVPR